ncbi:MAG: TIGR02147 family protein, partial [Pseudomonadota bacterium]
IFEFLHYRDYLKSKLGGKGTRTGQRKVLSEHLKVHTTLISQIVLGKAELSLEQAEGTNAFFGHSQDESEYFILLVLKARAGTKALESRWQTKIQEMRSRYLNIGKRIEPEAEIDPRDQAQFYSSYLYSALHVLVSIPEFQNAESLAKLLNRSPNEINEKLDFLKRLGLVVEDKGQLNYGPQHIHLSSDSFLIHQHHNNWRLRAMHSIENPVKNDLHYSAALTLSQEDAYKIKDSMIQNLQDNIKVISKSKEEVAYVYCMDFFALR